ncbi:hypothetical protein Tco_0307358 [Tanacetum coccineum]
MMACGFHVCCVGADVLDSRRGLVLRLLGLHVIAYVEFYWVMMFYIEGHKVGGMIWFDYIALVSPTPYVPPSKKDYKILFQPLFDEYFNPPPRTVSPDLVVVAAPRAVDPAGSPSSTIIDQDVPSASTSPTN